MPKTLPPPRLLSQSDNGCLERATNVEGKQPYTVIVRFEFSDGNMWMPVTLFLYRAPRDDQRHANCVLLR
ncbi:uncharacterized protein ColSpa_01537 [Colletotrichum spaethianum]|uniref:Uncharacterized protein n=1 Tax=Colletotrichum spaethianum TaxID=700344 RepID=A0AA37L412_9PEZI|nr:uncharacterized protein ColSpa_01537 [Colletotrichum spaethianum]GKT41356.1 hypothetical protein ColSpa_01537 [Colletotrichum spaethianum]